MIYFMMVSGGFLYSEVSLSKLIEVLAEPVVVETRTGQIFSGTCVEVNPERLVLLAEADDGSVEYTFFRSEVVRITLPGGSLKQKALELIAAGDVGRGLKLIDLLFAQQAPFHSYLAPATGSWFVEALPLYRTNGRLNDGLARAQKLAAEWVLDEGDWVLLEDEILLSTLLAGRAVQAEKLARVWIARQPRDASSALGWYALGTIQRQTGEDDSALFTFLRPIVFCGHTPVPFLAECYAGAIEVALALKRDSTAAALYREMAARQLTWPQGAPALPESFISLFP